MKILKIQQNTRQTTNYKLQTNKGFTLIETLVAISLLVIAVSSPLSLAARSLFSAHYAKDQLVASHLAQEAIEIVRQKRDQNLMLFLKDTINNDRQDWLRNTQLEDAVVGTKVIVIMDVSDISNLSFILVDQISGIDDNSSILKHDGSIYNHSSGNDTYFRRVIELTKISDYEIEVVARVRWKTGSFSARTFTIKENLYNWLP